LLVQDNSTNIDTDEGIDLIAWDWKESSDTMKGLTFAFNKTIFNNGKLDLSIKGSLMKVAQSGNLLNLVKMSCFGTVLARLDGILTAIDVSGHLHLDCLPVAELLAIKSLKSFACQGCPRVISTLLQTANGVKDFVALIKKVEIKTIFVDGKLDFSKGSNLLQSAEAGHARELVNLSNTPLFITLLHSSMEF